MAVIRRIIKAGNNLRAKIRSDMMYITDIRKTTPCAGDYFRFCERMDHLGLTCRGVYIQEDAGKKGYELSSNRLIYSFNTGDDIKSIVNDYYRILKYSGDNKPDKNMKAMYSIIQDMHEETMDPYTAHEIGIRFMEEVFCNRLSRCLIVMATHCSGSHIHNHFLVCALTRDHKAISENDFMNFTVSYMNRTTGRLMMYFGFPLREYESRDLNRAVKLNVWRSRLTGNYPMMNISYLQRDIDICIKLSDDMDSFFGNMRDLGYVFKKGRSVPAVVSNVRWKKNKEYPVFVTRPLREHKSLGYGYCLYDIRDRIAFDKGHVTDTLDDMLVPIENCYRYVYSPFDGSDRYSAAQIAKISRDISMTSSDEGEFGTIVELFTYMLSLDRNISSYDSENIRWISPEMRKYVSAANILRFRRFGLMIKEENISTLKEFKGLIGVYEGKLEKKENEKKSLSETQKKAKQKGDISKDLKKAFARVIAKIRRYKADMSYIRYICENIGKIAGDIALSLSRYKRIDEVHKKKLMTQLVIDENTLAYEHKTTRKRMNIRKLAEKSVNTKEHIREKDIADNDREHTENREIKKKTYQRSHMHLLSSDREPDL